MEKRLLQLLSLFLCMTNLSLAKQVTIKGVITNSSPFKYVYLMEFFGNNVLKKDSTLIKSNEFSFISQNGYPRGFYQLKFDETKYINLILSNESLSLNADLNNLNSSLKINSSRENDIYLKYKAFSDQYNYQMKDLQAQVNSAYASQSSDPVGAQTRMNNLKKRYDSLNQVQQKYFKGLAEDGKSLFVSKLIQQLIVDSSTTKENFLQPAHFKDDELLRGDVLITKINMYFQLFVEPSLPAYEQESKNLINKTAGTKGQEIIFTALLNMFGSVDMDLTSTIASEYVKAFPKSSKAKSILASLPKGSPKVGDEAPNIVLPDQNGKNISLSSLRGKIVLIDFWASWCGPCRVENPNVVNVFNKYKDKGFMIYGVSLDRDKSKWLQAIEKDNLTWLHVSDLKDWKSEGAELYGVRSIPATFLIDKNGKIIAKNLRGAQLELELKKLFEKN